MNRSIPLLAVAASMAISLWTHAQPAVDLPPGRLACSVEVTPSATSGMTKPPQPPVRWIKHVDIVRDGNLQRDMVTWSNGVLLEVWRVFDAGVLLAARSTGDNDVNVFPINSSYAGDYTLRILALDPGSLSWLAPSSLMGQVSKDGTNVFEYRTAVLVPGYLPHDPPRQIFYEAWVDAKTFTPTAFSDGDNLCKLTFAGPPPDPLVMPDRFQNVLKYYQRANSIGRRL